METKKKEKDNPDTVMGIEVTCFMFFLIGVGVTLLITDFTRLLGCTNNEEKCVFHEINETTCTMVNEVKSSCIYTLLCDKTGFSYYVNEEVGMVDPCDYVPPIKNARGGDFIFIKDYFPTETTFEELENIDLSNTPFTLYKECSEGQYNCQLKQTYKRICK